MSYQENKALQDQVVELKRAGDLDRAIALLERWVDDEESQGGKRGDAVASWPYYQLAVIARKQKRFDDEISILERYTQQPNSGSKQGQELYHRLLKVYELSGNPKGDDDPLFMRKALLIDTETTGLSRDDEVIEVGMVLFAYSNLSGRIFNVEAEYTGLSEPSFTIPAAATAKHGLTDSDVRGCRLDHDRIQELLAAADILIAHNASFDRRMLIGTFPEIESKLWYCSMNGIDWSTNGCSSKKLETLFTHYGICGNQRHRALDDARMSLALLSRINDRTEQPFLHELIRGQPAGFVSAHKDHENTVAETRERQSKPKPRGVWQWLKRIWRS